MITNIFVIKTNNLLIRIIFNLNKYFIILIKISCWKIVKQIRYIGTYYIKWLI